MPLRVTPIAHVLSPIRRGLVAEYLFYEGEGTTLHDTSGNGNHGTIYGGVTWKQLVNGKHVLKFNGVDGYVEVPPINNLSEFTIEALFYMESDGGMIFDKDFTDPGYRYGVLILPEAYGRKVRLHFGNGTTFQCVDSLTSIETHRWYYIAVTYRAGDVARFYINGIFDVERSVTNGVAVGRTTAGIIGARQDLNRGFFKGYIPLLRIYSRFLSEREIRYNMLTAIAQLGTTLKMEL